MPNWSEMIYPSGTILEVVIRGSVMYLSLFIFMRVILKRQSGSLGTTDLLLITLLADASQNGMAGEYRSLPEGIALVLTIIAWNLALNWLSFHSTIMRKLIEPRPLPLIHNGKMLRRNMRHELITVEELHGQLREEGIDDISKVALATIESDGQISVVKRDAD